VISVLRTALSRGHARKLAAGAALVMATLAIAVGPALAASPAVFRNIPTVLPGNVGSLGYEANSINELGDLVQLAAGDRASANLPVTVVMSSWGCQRGGDATCSTDPGATWPQPLTLTIYNVDLTGAVPAVGTVVLKTTQTFAIPYRPSYDPAGPCAAKNSTGWYSTLEAKCYNGFVYPVTFALPADITLPDELIWSVVYNTSHRGYVPLGDDPTNALNNPWDSLNLAAVPFPGELPAGTDVEPDAAFVSVGTGGTFGRDAGGWSAMPPLVCFGYCPINLAAAPTPTPPPPTLAPTAAASVTATPSEQVGGVTATPVSATLPPTSSKGPSDGGSSGLLVLLISLGFGSLGLLAVGAQRRTVRQ
jgi:hypothetical protein